MRKLGKLQIEEFELDRSKKMIFVAIFVTKTFHVAKRVFVFSNSVYFYLSLLYGQLRSHLIRYDVAVICISGFMRLWWYNKQIVYLAWDVSKRFTGLPAKHTYAWLTCVRSHLGNYTCVKIDSENIDLCFPQETTVRQIGVIATFTLMRKNCEGLEFLVFFPLVKP